MQRIGQLPDNSRIGLVQTGSSKDLMEKISFENTQYFKNIKKNIRKLEYGNACKIVFSLYKSYNVFLYSGQVKGICYVLAT